MRRCRYRQPEPSTGSIACNNSPGDVIKTATPRAARSTGSLEVQQRGAGEIVLNCMASDGVRSGFDMAQLRAVRACCSVPLVASGGAGAPRIFPTCFASRESMRRLAASVFHSGELAIADLKRRLRADGIEVRTMTALTELDWGKGDGLLPAIVQDATTGAVLMLGYMNRDALEATLASGRVTFWSRSKAGSGPRARPPEIFSSCAVSRPTATATHC
jgi:hypothetical protein